MKARTENGQIKIYKSLPSEYTKDDGTVILNFRNADAETIEAEGFYDVVKPSFNPLTQTKGELYFDAENEIVTYDVTNIDFSQDVDIIGEDGETTGDTEKRYKVSDLQSSILSELKQKANHLLKPSDWQVVRKFERDIDIDSDTQTERSGILTELDRKESEVNALTSYADLLQYDKRFFPPSEDEIV
jgi:hypothetical protein